jgi:hypothetical protein
VIFSRFGTKRSLGQIQSARLCRLTTTDDIHRGPYGVSLVAV